MGFLWLSTVPLTNGIVAEIFGVRYLSMLGGFVFLSHQVGSFLGVWLGGRLYDATGSYDVVWWIAIALGVFAASSTCRSASGRSCARRWHEAGAASPRWTAAALALAGGVRGLPAARPRRRPRQPDLELLLTRAVGGAMTPQRSPPSPWMRALGAPDRAGRQRPRRRRRQRPAHALARRARPRASPRVDRDAAALAPLAASPRSSSPTSRPARGRSPAAASTPSSSPTTSGGRCCRRSSAALAPGGVLLYETFAAGNETRRPAVAARLPARARVNFSTPPRVCASWPTKTAS